MTARELLYHWLKVRINAKAITWLDEKIAAFANSPAHRVVFTAFSSAPRFCGKGSLQLTAAELGNAQVTVTNWLPKDWTLEDAARISLLLALPANAASAKLIQQIYDTADVGEAVTLQRSLALLPNPLNHMAWARDGIRSNIQSVFEAISLNNPYPALYFDEIGWNQLVVKTLFMGLSIQNIVGLDTRVNTVLAGMFLDLAHERWAAGREISPEFWRCVGPFAHESASALADLKRILTSGTLMEKRAAVLVLLSNPHPDAQKLLEIEKELAQAAKHGTLTWENFNHVS